MSKYHAFSTLNSALGVFLSRLLQIPSLHKPSVAAGISLQVNGIYPFLPHYKGALLSLLRVAQGHFEFTADKKGEYEKAL